MKRTVIGTIAGVVAGFMVKRWMDKGIINEQAHIIGLYEEYTRPGSPDNVTKTYPPSAIWICEHCKALMMFQCSPEELQKYIEQINSFDAIYCPQCDELSVIDEQTRDNLNWSENV